MNWRSDPPVSKVLIIKNRLIAESARRVVVTMSAFVAPTRSFSCFGADANTGVFGPFLRESATTGRENKPAGETYFSRKLRCQSSNISNRQS